jgi:hypothetical protein
MNKQEFFGQKAKEHFELIKEMHQVEKKTYQQVSDFFNSVGVTLPSGKPVDTKAVSHFMIENGYRCTTPRAIVAKPTKNNNDFILTILNNKELSKLKKLALISNLID